MILRYFLKTAVTLAMALPLAASPATPAGGAAVRMDDHGGGGHGHGGDDGDGNNNQGNRGNDPGNAGNSQGAVGNNPGNAANNPGNITGNVGNEGEDGDQHDNNGAAPVNNGQQNVVVAGGMARTRVSLAATPAGTTIAAEGQVEIRVQGQRQRLTIEVEANVPDGTMFRALANGLDVGGVTIQFGEGELRLGDDTGGQLGTGLTPAAVTSIVVNDLSGTALLQAQFGAIAPAGATPPAANPPLRVRKRADLTPTPAGAAIGAGGRVELRAQEQRQRFKAEIEANVPDGTVFQVMANGTLMGRVAIRFGEAELELDTDASLLPPGLGSVASITTVQVTDSNGSVVLQAAL